jgi:hypothetical protein
MMEIELNPEKCSAKVDHFSCLMGIMDYISGTIESSKKIESLEEWEKNKEQHQYVLNTKVENYFKKCFNFADEEKERCKDKIISLRKNVEDYREKNSYFYWQKHNRECYLEWRKQKHEEFAKKQFKDNEIKEKAKKCNEEIRKEFSEKNVMSKLDDCICEFEIKNHTGEIKQWDKHDGVSIVSKSQNDNNKYNKYYRYIEKKYELYDDICIPANKLINFPPCSFYNRGIEKLNRKFPNVEIKCFTNSYYYNNIGLGPRAPRFVLYPK